MAKKMIIKSVDTFFAKMTDSTGTKSEVVTLGTLQNLRITFNTEIEDIFGGDGLFPIDILVRSKSIEITATDAQFDLNMLRMMMGSPITENKDDYIWVLNETHTVPSDGVITLNYSSDIYDNEIYVRVVDTGKVLLQVPSSSSVTPTTFSYNSTTHAVIVDTSLAGKQVAINYKKRQQGVDILDIGMDEIPFVVSVVHHGSYMQADNTFAGIETEIYACRAQGQFTINAARATASANEVTLRVVDPGRPDGKLGRVKRFTTNVKI